MKLILIFKEDFFVLGLDCADAGIAVLDTRSTSVLKNIKKKASMHFNIFKDESPSYNNANDENGHCISADMINCVIDIYGPRKDAKAVGAELSQAKIYLQHPHNPDTSKRYENPHYFKTRRQKSRSTAQTPRLLPEIQARTLDEPRVKMQASLVDAVLRTHVQNESIGEAEIDCRVSTELLPHQKQALHFVMQRERVLICEGLSLWTGEGTKENPRYRHSIVTNFRTAAICPEETRGGILADEMGLGKTLSILSAIVISLDEAILFSKEKINSLKDRLLPKTRATLVIAPSTGLLFQVSFEQVSVI